MLFHQLPLAPPPAPAPHEDELLEESLDLALSVDDITCSHQLFDFNVSFFELIVGVFNASIYHDEDGSRPLKTGGTFVPVIVDSLVIPV